jgi:pyruvate dehydrogenase E1 component
MPSPATSAADLALLESIQRRVLWLSIYTVHHANALRPNPDGTKVGGHQASSASLVSALTALYFAALRPGDAVALKAHASPAFYAIQYLRGRLDAAALRGLRELGGLQAYPSRRKNPGLVDLSTGSMGLGAVAASFGALAARYLVDHFGGSLTPERFIVLVGDAELDEGNVWEALLEEAVATLGNLLWIVDLNRQSLDRVAPDGRRHQLRQMFVANGWGVIEARHGRRRQACFAQPGGAQLRRRLEDMPNGDFHALLRSAPAAARKALASGPGGAPDPAIETLLAGLADEDVSALVADVGGHDIASILAALDEAEGHGEAPAVILLDTIKGWGLPLAADPLNHGALLTAAQIEALREALGVAPGHEWARFAPESPEGRLIGTLPPLFASPTPTQGSVAVPVELGESYTGVMSSQEAFGRVLARLARHPVGDRLVTLSADVALTTHLVGWISRRGVYVPRERAAAPPEPGEVVPWAESRRGQHLELGIAEHNLFLALGAFGLTRELSGQPLAPIGTLYDPFVTRGLDALYHALYSGGRFVVAATPSGVSLSREGGAHQSVITPGIAVTLPDLVYYDPAFAHEVEWILMDALARILDGTGESLYLRLSTRPVDQGLAPVPGEAYRSQVLSGGYRLLDGRSQPGWDPEESAVSIFACGVMVPESVEASRALRAEGIHASVFVVTSPDRLYRGLRQPPRPLETLVSADEEGVPVVSVLDGHSHALAFIGSALGVPQLPLGVDSFGQSGARPDLYAHYGIDAAAIARAARSLLGRPDSA